MSVVRVENERYTVDPLYQWDVNQVLEIRGLSLPSVPSIHFTNETMDKAIVRQAAMDGAGVITVDVPNSLLQKPYKIKAYICIYEGDTFETLYLIEIPVKSRKKPSDYTLEGDTEVYSFNALENLVNNAVIKFTVDNSSLKNEVTKICNETVNGVNGKVAGIEYTATEALTIAKGKNRARVFYTTENMEAWLSNKSNAGLCNVGDNLYIVELDVPDWWISEVLTEVDNVTGYYYKIAKLETQKVDLTEINNKLNAMTDYVIERGTKDGWTYEKWNNGKMECWGTASRSEPYSGNASYCHLYVPFPFDFVGYPTPYCSGFQFQKLESHVSLVSATDTHLEAFMHCYETPSEQRMCHFHMRVVGKWKE